jgi:hypothetical protein
MLEQKDFTYDDDDAIAFIRNYLPRELNDKYDDDDILHVIGLIGEYYESKGFFDGRDEDVVEIDEEELLRYVTEHTGRLSADDTMFIVMGELAYCDSIHLFE